MTTNTFNDDTRLSEEVEHMLLSMYANLFHAALMPVYTEMMVDVPLEQSSLAFLNSTEFRTSVADRLVMPQHPLLQRALRTAITDRQFTNVAINVASNRFEVEAGTHLPTWAFIIDAVHENLNDAPTDADLAPALLAGHVETVLAEFS